MKPASLSAVTVRSTCSMQGLKQHIRVIRSVCQPVNITIDMTDGGSVYVTLKAFLACSTASHGIGRSRNTNVRTVIRRGMRVGLLVSYIPASTVSTTVNPSLQTFLCDRVTISSIP